MLDPCFVCLCSKIFTLQHSIFCDISQAQYFHLYQIATSFCLKFFLSSLPRISLPHLLSLSTSLSDFLNFQHFFCKYFCYVAKLFFNTTFTKLFFNTSFAKFFSTLLPYKLFQHAFCITLFIFQSVNNFFCSADQIQQKIVYHDLDIFTLDKFSTPVDTNHTVGGSLCINTSLQSECKRSLHYET